MADAKKKTAVEPTWEDIGKAVGAKIEQETKDGSCRPWGIKEHTHGQGAGGAFYGLGFVGALVYYLTTATSFWMGVIGVLKAIVWPAFLVYEILKFLKM